MRLTQYTDYSLRVLIFLSLRPGEMTTIQQISDAYGISRNHLMKVVQQLVRKGYVDSVRGQHGGIRLRRAPETIRIGGVVREMEPDTALLECQRPNGVCVISPVCGLPAVFECAQDKFYEELDRHTIADLVDRGRPADLIDLLNV